MANPQVDPKQLVNTNIMIASMFALLLVLLAIFIGPKSATSTLTATNQVFIAISLISVGIGALYAQRRLRAKELGNSRFELPPLDQFQVDMLIALAFFELCGLLGVFLVEHRVFTYTLVTIAVMGIVFFVLPRVLLYKRIFDEQNRS